jgi:HEAT repeat protein
LGESSVEFVIRRYGELSCSSYQRLLLIQVVGRLGSPLAKPFLLERLHGANWEERMEAAVGLGRLRATEYIPIMRMRLQAEQSAGIVGAVYGVHCGLARMGEDASRTELREALLPATVAMVNAGMTRVAVECLKELQDSVICELLPGVMSHEDLYLRRESFAAAGALKCLQTDVLLALGRGLGDRVPSAGRQARTALESITGVRFADERSLRDYLDAQRGGSNP